MSLVLNRQSMKESVFSGLQCAMRDYRLAAPTQRGDRFLFDYVEDVNEILTDYIPTILPPKKFFFPQKEVILEYTFDGKVRAKIDSEKLVLFGVSILLP